MRPVVAVIARIPRPGESKTRLAADLGDEAAARLADAFVQDELEALASAGWDLALLHDRPRDAAERAWCEARRSACGRPVALVETPGDDLAAALDQGMRALLRRGLPALILAADVPTVGQSQVAEALARLEAGADVVFGHSGDGGYYLVGMSEAHDAFTGIPMGTTRALPATEALCAARGLTTERIAEVPDVDRLPDLEALAEALRPALAPRTAALLRELLPEQAPARPHALHLELTNRCNLACRFCLTAFEGPEPPRDLTLEEALRITGGLPELRWAALHLNGESLLAPALVPVARSLAERGVETVLNTNAVLLEGRLAEELAASGLSELRVSVPAAARGAYAAIAGADELDRVEANVAAFVARRAGRSRPRVALWTVGTREACAEAEALVELAARVGADEAYVQRLVWTGRGLATAEHAPGSPATELLQRAMAKAEARAAALGVALGAPGNLPPSRALLGAGGPSWRECRRPWYTAAVTAHGTVLPCCIASFAAPYAACSLGNVLAETWEEVFAGARYRALRRALLGDRPWPCCGGCGTAYSP